MNFRLFIVGLIPFLSTLQSAEINETEFHSQASQDKFVYSIIHFLADQQESGCYLEIGAGEPIIINNSYFFEKILGWKGISIDISDTLSERWHAVRTNPLLSEDATKTNYDQILKTFPKMIDYLSLDVDGYYDTVLNRLPFNEHIFKVITIEHDYYRYGDLYREKERQILKSHGYHLLCSNVMHAGHPFEDWWIHPSTFSSEAFSTLTSLDLEEKEHTEIIKSILNAISDQRSH
jgi:hypothetical protein